LPKGVYPRKPRASTAPCSIITCAVCGTPRRYHNSFLRVHPIRFCSRTCAGVAARKPDAYVSVACFRCGRMVTRRRTHLKPTTYCSRICMRTRVQQAKIEKSPFNLQEWRAKNRSRLNAWSTAWSQNHRTQRLESQRRYRANHKGLIALTSFMRRSQKRKNAATANQVEQIMKRARGFCVYCGKHKPLTLDHVAPLSRGGDHRRTNLVPACRSCNSSKGASDVVNWAERQFGVMGIARAVMFLEGKRIPSTLLVT